MKPLKDVGRHFGFDWEAELDEEYGDVLFMAKQQNARGGYFMIVAGGGDGEEFEPFGLYEQGGRGPDVWDWEHGEFESLIEAMREARRLHLKELQYTLDWEKANLPPKPDMDCRTCFGDPLRTLRPGLFECPECGGVV